MTPFFSMYPQVQVNGKALPLETKNPPVLAGDFVPSHILAGETMTLTGFEPVSRP